MQWYVYIVQCADNTFYIGSTNDLEHRLATHNSGKGAKYTRGRLPVQMIYSEECESRSLAAKREAQLKKLSRAEKELLIRG